MRYGIRVVLSWRHPSRMKDSLCTGPSFTTPHSAWMLPKPTGHHRMTSVGLPILEVCELDGFCWRCLWWFGASEKCLHLIYVPIVHASVHFVASSPYNLKLWVLRKAILDVVKVFGRTHDAVDNGFMEGKRTANSITSSFRSFGILRRTCVLREGG
jgi:hypothetical protein